MSTSRSSFRFRFLPSPPPYIISHSPLIPYSPTLHPPPNLSHPCPASHPHPTPVRLPGLHRRRRRGRGRGRRRLARRGRRLVRRRVSVLRRRRPVRPVLGLLRGGRAVPSSRIPRRSLPVPTLLGGHASVVAPHRGLRRGCAVVALHVCAGRARRVLLVLLRRRILLLLLLLLLLLRGRGPTVRGLLRGRGTIPPGHPRWRSLGECRPSRRRRATIPRRGARVGRLARRRCSVPGGGVLVGGRRPVRLRGWRGTVPSSPSTRRRALLLLCPTGGGVRRRRRRRP